MIRSERLQAVQDALTDAEEQERRWGEVMSQFRRAGNRGRRAQIACEQFIAWGERVGELLKQLREQP